jgi:hypothetical protein
MSKQKTLLLVIIIYLHQWKKLMSLMFILLQLQHPQHYEFPVQPVHKAPTII